LIFQLGIDHHAGKSFIAFVHGFLRPIIFSKRGLPPLRLRLVTGVLIPMGYGAP
jgi:hypothetical protein